MTHMYFSARTEGIRTFRHALRAAYRTAISAAQILVKCDILGMSQFVLLKGLHFVKAINAIVAVFHFKN